MSFVKLKADVVINMCVRTITREMEAANAQQERRDAAPWWLKWGPIPILACLAGIDLGVPMERLGKSGRQLVAEELKWAAQLAKAEGDEMVRVDVDDLEMLDSPKTILRS